MPKELTHWVLAEKTLENMDPSVLKESIARYKQVYYIGAVVLDSPFYNLFSRDDATPRLGKKLHKQSEVNLFQRFAHILQHFDFSPPDSFWAFLAGVITHIHADQTFHPVIFYFCGKDNTNDERARAYETRHRKLESFLDLHYFGDIRLINHGRLSISLKQMKIDHQTLRKYTGLLYFENELRATKADNALTRHARIQNLFQKRPVKNFLALINRIPGIDLSSTLSLFYPAYKKIVSPFFKDAIVYYHPVNGAVRGESIADLEKKTIAKNCNLFIELERHLNTAALKDILLSVKPASLETGLPPAEDNMMKHFDLSKSIECLLGLSETACRRPEG
ncbi:zinc dependent phospholipase C family protein [Thermodesulfobacteriota bacterium]